MAHQENITFDVEMWTQIQLGQMYQNLACARAYRMQKCGMKSLLRQS